MARSLAIFLACTAVCCVAAASSSSSSSCHTAAVNPKGSICAAGTLGVCSSVDGAANVAASAYEAYLSTINKRSQTFTGMVVCKQAGGVIGSAWNDAEMVCPGLPQCEEDAQGCAGTPFTTNLPAKADASLVSMQQPSSEGTCCASIKSYVGQWCTGIKDLDTVVAPNGDFSRLAGIPGMAHVKTCSVAADCSPLNLKEPTVPFFYFYHALFASVGIVMAGLVLAATDCGCSCGHN